MNRKKEFYQQTVAPALMKTYGKKNPMAVARLSKISLNIGIGSEPQGEKALPAIIEQLSRITGQKPKTNSARISIAAFKLREGSPIGVSVTLRNDRMWEFFDKFVTIVLPQFKDFSGVSRKAFDEAGNYTVGLKEQIVFPEISYDDIDRVRGMEITFVVENASSKQESMDMLEQLGMAFTKKEQNG